MAERRMTDEEFARLCREGRVIERKGGQPRVVAIMADGRECIVKIWDQDDHRVVGRRRAPHRHFARACRRINDLGITAPTVEAAGTIPSRGASWVCYALLPGTPLRAMLRSPGGAAPAPGVVARWICRLHDKGVYFRGLTPSNILCHGRAFALIDVSDTSFRRGGLSRALRVRNLGSFIAHPAELERMLAGLGETLVRAYASVAGLDPARLWRDVSRDIERRGSKRARTRRRRGREPLAVGEYPADDEQDAY